jgi:hypothetical protein
MALHYSRRATIMPLRDFYESSGRSLVAGDRYQLRLITLRLSLIKNRESGLFLFCGYG